MAIELDPVKYEIFLGRLRSILEEGRIAISMVSGSPAIVEGGECQTSFYDARGNALLSASGTLFHTTGSAEAIHKTMELYEDNPGINDGDQFYYADPYIAGTHLLDQIMVKPIFFKGKRVAWVGTMTHTGDAGGVLRGASTEIFHEGVRIPGLKVVDGGEIRFDAFRTITEQCRDPDYVGLDIMARIASNNVCAEGFLRLIDRLGREFVQAACEKLQDDAKKLVQAKLQSMPDGTWRQRVYWSRTKRIQGVEKPVPFKVMCTMTKKGDQLTFDCTGTSPQNEDYANCTYVAARAKLFVALAGFLFWDVPWNAGMASMVKLVIPEGTVLNCRYPAATGLATKTGSLLTDAGMGCIARMMYAAGNYDYVNSSWIAGGGGGPGLWYGGHDQHGRVAGSAVYELFAAGEGATPCRDGNNTGGSTSNAKACISDIEWQEMYFPFLYLARRQCTDSGGFGKFRGGMGLEPIQMIYGSKDLTVDFLPTPSGGEVRGFGLFGGYPVGNVLGGSMLLVTSSMTQKLSQGKYPITYDELGPPWGVDAKRKTSFEMDRQLGGIRVHVPEYSILVWQMDVGGGYGDPLDRAPAMVAQDVKTQAVSLAAAAKFYGVVIDPDTLEVDVAKTEERRRQIRQERLSKGERIVTTDPAPKAGTSANKRSLIRIHEYLEIVEKIDGGKAIVCIKCGNDFCPPGDNYKKYALRWTKDIREVKVVPEDEPSLEYYQEYICPGCGTLLQVDTWCPELDSDEPLWDIDVRV
jgi:N-methylhydantoinase B